MLISGTLFISADDMSREMKSQSELVDIMQRNNMNRPLAPEAIPTHAVPSPLHRPTLTKPSPLSQSMNMNSSNRSSSPVYAIDTSRIDLRGMAGRPTTFSHEEENDEGSNPSIANSIPQKRKELPPSPTLSSDLPSKRLQTSQSMNIRPHPSSLSPLPPPLPAHENEIDNTNISTEVFPTHRKEASHAPNQDGLQKTTGVLDDTCSQIFNLFLKWSKDTNLDKSKIKEQARLIYYHHLRVTLESKWYLLTPLSDLIFTRRI